MFINIKNTMETYSVTSPQMRVVPDSKHTFFSGSIGTLGVLQRRSDDLLLTPLQPVVQIHKGSQDAIFVGNEPFHGQMPFHVLTQVAQMHMKGMLLGHQPELSETVNRGGIEATHMTEVKQQMFKRFLFVVFNSTQHPCKEPI